MLYEEYDEQTLRKLQNIELEMLKDFIGICEKYDIDYFGWAGTALGAVRHGGFIPWDDDIDIGLTRKNYNKFLDVAQKESKGRYKLINVETERGYPLPNTRWAMEGTRFKEECFKNLDIDNGIFLDLYCFDNIADNDQAMRRQGWTAWFWGKLMVLSEIREPVLYIHGYKAKMVLFCCAVVHDILKLFHASPYFFYKKAMKAARKYEGVQTKRIAYFFDPTPFTSVVDRRDTEPARIYDFNGLKVHFLNRIEVYLELQFGDYMKLPPENERHNHYPFLLEFPEDH